MDINALLPFAQLLSFLLPAIVGVWVLYKLSRLIDALSEKVGLLSSKTDPQVAQKPEKQEKYELRNLLPPAVHISEAKENLTYEDSNILEDETSAPTPRAGTLGAANAADKKNLPSPNVKPVSHMPAATAGDKPSSGAIFLSNSPAGTLPVESGSKIFPLVQACSACGKEYRLRKSGWYLCKCGNRFSV
jgi:hypothetical protein